MYIYEHRNFILDPCVSTVTTITKIVKSTNKTTTTTTTTTSSGEIIVTE